MKYTICLLLLFSFNAASAKDGKSAHNGEIAMNLATLSTGIPELQVVYFINKHVGLVTSGGYHLYPYQTLYKQKGLTSVISLRGTYYRLGIKGCYSVIRKGKTNHVWLQLMGVYTSYKESYYDKRDSLTKGSSGSGIGVSISSGADFQLVRHLDFRIGLQTGVSPEFPEKISSFTPGYGWTVMPLQLIVGLSYRFSIFQK